MTVLPPLVLAESVDLDGEVREVSVLMADLRGFTMFCEQVAPWRVSRMLNEYWASMADVILQQKGRVQEFVGDGILGVFGAPDRDADHAWHAALAALDMQAAIRWLSGRWLREDGTPFALGVALHTGDVFAGAVGSPHQRKFGVVGDTVNTVARLEELNRRLGTATLMSGEALARLGDRVDVRARGAFTLRDRRHAVEVFELFGARRMTRGASGATSHGADLARPASGVETM